MNKQEAEWCGVLGHDSALQGYTGLGTNWANGMNFVMNNAPSAGISKNKSIALYIVITPICYYAMLVQ